MTALFEFLFKYRPFVYEKGTLAFRPFWPPYVTWLLVLAAIVGSYLLYRRIAGALPASWQYTLAGLRAVAFLILILLLIQPVLVLNTVVPQKSFVAVVYDMSKSMEIRDGADGQSRIEAAKNLLRPVDNPLLEGLNEKFKLRFFRFSNTAERAASFEDIPHHGNITNLERTLNQVVAELSAVPLAGIVLVTDGADNHSVDLAGTVEQLRAHNIPVYSIGIGSSSFSRDTEVLRVTAPKKVLKDTSVEADLTVRAKGYPGRKTKLLVMDNDRILQSQEITLGSDDEVKTHKVNFSSGMAGSRIFKFRVEAFENELVSENNDQTVLIQVEDEQPQIFYTEGEPRWEYAFMRRAVSKDKNLQLITLLRSADGAFLRQGVESSENLAGGFPTDKAELFRYKAIIIGSVEASFFTFDQLRMISDFVSQRGGGFLMLGGRNSFGQGLYINTPLEDLLPLNVRFGQEAADVPDFQDLEYKVRLTSYGFQHPVTRLSLSETENRQRWDAAPPLVGYNPTSGPKPGTTVLAQGSVPDVRGQSPVILAFQRFGRGKSMALTTASTWRWRMELEHTDNFYEIFWKQMLRWLVNGVPDQVNIETEKHSYSLDEMVAFRAEVNDPSFFQINNAQVRAQVKAPSGETTSLQFTWEVDKDGQYSANFKPQEEGIYDISVEAFQGSKSLGTAKANFRIAESTEEFHNAALNVNLLQQLANDTGGRYYSLGDSRNLAEDISYVDSGISRMEEKDLWDMPFLFLLLMSVVSLEWILRKRKGLA